VTVAGGSRSGYRKQTTARPLCLLGVPLDVPAAAAAQALNIVAGLALTGGLAGPLLLAATGRPGLPAGFSVL
jgi:hypothetical protein